MADAILRFAGDRARRADLHDRRHDAPSLGCVGSTPGADRRNALKTGRARADTSLAMDERTFDHGDMVRGEGPGALAELAEQVRPVSLAGDQGLPLLGAFEPLVPGAGLRRWGAGGGGARAVGAGG